MTAPCSDPTQDPEGYLSSVPWKTNLALIGGLLIAAAHSF